jgi:FdhD protein
VAVWKARGGKSSKEADVVAAEEPMEIRVESGTKGRRETSCGVCGKTSLEAVRVAARYPMPRDGPTLSQKTIAAIPDQLRNKQTLFAETGGLHAAGIFAADGTLQSVREDVGRHNAVDKVVGEAFLADRVPLSERVLAVSGRASFEILQKAAVAGIPFVVAVGAPSNLSVTLAEEFRMTLVGFARGDRFNVYAGRERVSMEET